MADTQEAQIKENSKQRFNEQCFLMDNFRALASFNRARSDYKNFDMIEGEPSEAIHEIAAKPDALPLLSLMPAQLSLLVPKIQVFKINYRSQSSIPEETELVFRDHTDPHTIEAITSNRAGRGDDVGLKSFSYELAGKRLREEGTAACNLTLHFQNISALVERNPNPDKASFIDLLLPEARRTNVGTPDEPSREWNPKHFQIKIKTGWAVPVTADDSIISKDIKKSLETSLATLFLTFKSHNLDFKQNGAVDVSVDYQGRLESVLNNDKSNIFALSPRGSMALERLNKIDANRRARMKKSKPSASPPSPSEGDGKAEITTSKKGILSSFFGHIGEHSVSIEGSPATRISEPTSNIIRKSTIEEEEDREKRKLIRELSNDKQVLWSKILEVLISNKTKLYSIDVGKQIIVGFSEKQKAKLQQLLDDGKITAKEAKILESSARASRRNISANGNIHSKIRRVTSELKGSVNNFKYVRAGAAAARDAGKITIENEENIFSESTQRMGFETIEQTAKRIQEIEADASPNIPAGRGGQRRIHFFYFGDLMDIVLGVVKDKNRDDNYNLNMLMGPLVLDDFSSGGPVPANLADIPISLDLFVAWYLKNVVAKQRTRYVLKEFIKDVLETLIIRATGEDCFLTAGIRKPFVAVESFSLPGLGDTTRKRNPLRLRGSSGGERITIQELKMRTSENKIQRLAHQESKNTHSFFYFYVANVPTVGLSGKKEQDEKRGIFHFNIGADRGLVRNIKFSKTDQPHHATMRAAADSTDNKRLRDRYNASIEMEGNNIFSPGSYIYINTRLLSDGTSNKEDADRIATELGLGGYYQINKVSHNLDKHDYSTELDCAWINSGTKKIKALARVKATDISNTVRKAENLGLKLDER